MDTLEETLLTIVEVLLAPSTKDLVLIEAPAHRAVEGLHAVARACGDGSVVWWHVGEAAPEGPSEPSAHPAVLMIHGLEMVPEEAVGEGLQGILDVSSAWQACGWQPVVWVPPELGAIVEARLAENGTPVATNPRLDADQIPRDPDIEARRRYAAQALLTLSYRPLHPLASERYLRAVEDFYVEPLVATGRGSQALLAWSRSVGRAFLEGPPGSGKSIALAVMALDRARTCSLNPVLGDVPVLVSASEVVSALGAEDAVTPGTLLSRRAAVTWDDPEGMDQWLDRGDIVLLLDGADRLDEAADQRFWAWVQRLRADYPGTAVVVSGRQAPDRLPASWARARLEPFSDTQIATYAHQFFSLIEPRYRDRHVASLLDAIAQRSWLGEIARHPFHLLSLCLLVSRQGGLPRVRVRILEFLVESVLSRWEISGASDWTQRALREQIHDELSQLALQQRLAGAATFAFEDVEAVVGRERGDNAATDVSAETLLRAPLEAGLVEMRQKGRYAFAHPAFRDYLAVEPMVADIEHGVSRLGAHLVDRSWDDLVILAAGMAVRRYSWKLRELLAAIWPEDPDARKALAQERIRRLTLALNVLLEAEQDGETFMPWVVRASAALAEHGAASPPADLVALETARDRAVSRHGVPATEGLQA